MELYIDEKHLHGFSKHYVEVHPTTRKADTRKSDGDVNTGAVSFHSGDPFDVILHAGNWAKEYIKKKGHEAPLNVHIKSAKRTEISHHLSALIENARLKGEIEQLKKAAVQNIKRRKGTV